MDALISYIENYARLTEAEKEALRKYVDKKPVAKNELIFSAGAVSQEIYFVTRGCVRLFYDVDGRDRTAFFYTEGQFICAGESYTFGVPARENYQAVEDAEICVINKDSVEMLLELSPTFEIIARIATENELIASQNIIASFVTKTAEQRYRELLESNGELFQRVPQQYIASFLGVSPETLSRIKKRVFARRTS